MRFLFNVHGYKPAYRVGGPIHSVAALAEGLVAAGHSVFVATSNWDGTTTLDVDPEKVYDRDGVQVRYFSGRRTWLQRTKVPYFSKSSFFKFDPCFRCWLAEQGRNFDVFHTHITYLSSTPSFSRAAVEMGKVYLFHQRGNLDPVRLRYRGLKKRCYVKFVEVPAMRRADVLVALTDYEVSTYRALGLSNRVVVLPNGVDSDRTSQQNADCNAALSKFVSSLEDTPLFLFMGRLHPIKGVDLFVQAFVQFALACKCGVGVVAGPDDSGLADVLQGVIRAAGLDNRFWCGRSRANPRGRRPCSSSQRLARPRSGGLWQCAPTHERH